MRTLLLLLFLPLFGFGQGSQNDLSSGQVIQDSIPGTSIILKDGNILFKKVYTSNLEKEALSEKLGTLVSIMKGFKINNEIYQTNDQIVGRLFRHKFNVNKYDISSLSASSILYSPFNAVVIVQIKDFKYQVIISNIGIGEDGADSLKHRPTNDTMLETFMTEKKGSKLKARKGYVKLAQTLNQEFADLFDLRKSNLAADF
ncbi:hypothetical protein [Pedobacter sp. B4-66]|uniref:hypothetical protein n=1 Tax=Pedobacter sp. B4-66 TaxID=2817280 RepID=UPI001BDB4C4E|nr:hypothetical protein [Pedobacter sp. B4-66]